MGDVVTRRGHWRRNVWLLITYLLFAASGVLAVVGPPPVLLRQGGHVIAIAWAACGLIGASLGAYGTLRQRPTWELLGITIGASASLTWAVALIMQAVTTHTLSPLTSACMASVVVTLISQRWTQISREVREDRRK